MVVALGGFLFGFDTAVISGAEKAIQQLWDLSAVGARLHHFHCPDWHGVRGHLRGHSFRCAGPPPAPLPGLRCSTWCRRWARRLSPAWVPFMIFRFLGGLGVGASSVTAPLYISEVSPPESRGRMVGMFQFNIVFGILVAYLSNYLLKGIGPDSLALDAGRAGGAGPRLLPAAVPHARKPALAARGRAAWRRPAPCSTSSTPPRPTRTCRHSGWPTPPTRRPGRVAVGARSTGGRCCWPCSLPSSTSWRASTPSSTTPRAFSR